MCIYVIPIPPLGLMAQIQYPVIDLKHGLILTSPVQKATSLTVLAACPTQTAMITLCGPRF